MSRKIILEKPTRESPLEYVLDYLKYQHIKTHVLHAYRLLARLDVDKGHAVADLGCAGTETVFLLEKLGYKNITVADYEGSVLDDVRKNYSHGEVKCCRADFNKPLPFKDRTFRVITSFEVVEHIVKAEFFLSEVGRILRPDGYFITTTPNHAFYMSRWRALKGMRLGTEGTHYRFFTKDHFEEILDRAGFRIVGRISIGHLPFVNMEPWRTIARRKRIGHYVPDALESLFAINFVWLCVKK